MKHLELIKLLEEGEGVDYWLSAEIICALLAPETAYVKESHINGRWCIFDGVDRVQRPKLWRHTPAFYLDLTSSLDACISLLREKLPGWRVSDAGNADLYEHKDKFRLDETNWVVQLAADSDQSVKWVKGCHKEFTRAMLIAILKAVGEGE